MFRAAAGLASKARAATSSGRQIGSRFDWIGNYAAKDVKFGSEARESMLRGVEGPKILGYERSLPCFFSTNAQGNLTSSLSPTEKKSMEEARKVVYGATEHAGHVDRREVTCFSPLEAISIKPRSGSLGSESLKIKRTELSQKITFALVPALVLISKSSLTTSLLVLSVYWQIYGYFKEIFLDYVHQDVTRKWVLLYLQLLLLILIKDTFLDFGLV